MKVNELEVDFQQWARYAIVSLFATLPKTCSPWDLAAVSFFLCWISGYEQRENGHWFGSISPQLACVVRRRAHPCISRDTRARRVRFVEEDIASKARHV